MNLNGADSTNLVEQEFSVELEYLKNLLHDKPDDIETLEKLTELFLGKREHQTSLLFKHQCPQQFADIGNTSLSSFRDKYKGKRVFVIGNGPSLRDTPLNLLRNEYTFAMNRIALTYKTTKWRPSFFLCTTTNVVRPDWNKDIRESLE